MAIDYNNLPPPRDHEEVLAERAYDYISDLLMQGRTYQDARLLAEATAEADMAWEMRQQR